MKPGQCVVRSIPNRHGQVYARMDRGGRERMTSAVQYMDHGRQVQLYALRNEQAVAIGAHEGLELLDQTQARYMQHLVVTTDIPASELLLDERDIAERVGRMVLERRPDAELYAVAVHGDTEAEERHLHVHLALGTQTTLRHDDLRHFREQARELATALRQEHGLDLEPLRTQVLERRHEQDHQQIQDEEQRI